MSLISALSGPAASGGAALTNALSGLSSNAAAVEADAGTSTSGSNGSSSASGSTSASATDPSDPLGNESTFLTLLVSQLQNQDPLSPTDSNQFVSQLTSFSQLEQLINIDQNTTSLASSVTSATSSGTQPTTGASS